MLANTGKNATIVAQTTSEANGSPTQTMISGAIATIGVTCSTTAHGWIAAASSRLEAIATASTTPSSAATNSAANVTSSVEPSDDNSPDGSATKRGDDRRRSRHQIRWHLRDPHRRLPGNQCSEAEQQRRQVFHAANARSSSRVTRATSAA